MLHYIHNISDIWFFIDFLTRLSQISISSFPLERLEFRQICMHSGLDGQQYAQNLQKVIAAPKMALNVHLERQKIISAHSRHY